MSVGCFFGKALKHCWDVFKDIPGDPGRGSKGSVLRLGSTMLLEFSQSMSGTRAIPGGIGDGTWYFLYTKH